MRAKSSPTGSQGRRNPEQKHRCALAGAVEMLAKGVTACSDLVHEHPVPSVEGLQAIAQAYHDAGIRAVVCPMTTGRSFDAAIPGLADALPGDLRAEGQSFRLAPVEQTLTAVEAVMRDWRWPRERVAPAVAPKIPMRGCVLLIQLCIELADEHGTGIQMHLSNSRFRSRRPRSPAARRSRSKWTGSGPPVRGWLPHMP